MARITEAQLSDALIRIKKRIERDIPIGCRVCLKSQWRKRWPRYAHTRGTVTRYSKSVSLIVLFDGRKTASGYHPGFFKRVRP